MLQLNNSTKKRLIIKIKRFFFKYSKSPFVLYTIGYYTSAYEKAGDNLGKNGGQTCNSQLICKDEEETKTYIFPLFTVTHAAHCA